LVAVRFLMGRESVRHENVEGVPQKTWGLLGEGRRMAPVPARVLLT